MKLEELQIPVENVKEELDTLKKGIKEGYISKRSKIVRDLLAIYGHMQHRREIVDIYKAFQEAGLTEEGHPKLAIVRADASFCHLYKKNNGGAIFSNERKTGWSINAVRGNGDVELPSATYEWKQEKLEERHFKTVTPMIPPRISVACSARLVPYHYHIMFEAEYWASDPEPPRPPRDPILGRMITRNIFAVEAVWELMELESSLLIGKLRR